MIDRKLKINENFYRTNTVSVRCSFNDKCDKDESRKLVVISFLLVFFLYYKFGISWMELSACGKIAFVFKIRSIQIKTDSEEENVIR